MSPSTNTYDEPGLAPFPYRRLAAPKLYFIEKFGDYFATQRRSVKIDVLSTFPAATSQVMHVRLKDNPGSIQEAVLKLYDRRWAGSIRQETQDKKATAPSLAAENAYASFVRSGKMHVFSLALRQIYETAPDKHKPRAIDFYSDQSDGVERYEAAVWYENDQRFKTELQTYKQLESIQGNQIPRLYAHVRIPVSFVGPGSSDGTAESEQFLCVHGLLLEYIPGPQFKDWVNRPNIGLTALAQRAVNSIFLINDLGVLVQKCCDDVIVADDNNASVGGSKKPFIVGFAEARFKKDLIMNEIKQFKPSDLLAIKNLKERMDIAY
ncbi:hypothetical protein FGADI_9534 [Fusarium gaditjirri]|uniref:Uncharacterized protein n=1 Tax=Fusarium gaditjirri TaxID=282569 RepID=A0A8H4SZR6_9HYPO|nr:hypothetical protein FGADI_9534 [Fusarium gaditjirri]